MPFTYDWRDIAAQYDPALEPILPVTQSQPAEVPATPPPAPTPAPTPTPTPQPQPNLTASPYDDAIQRIATEEGVSPVVLKALIKQESGFNPKARSGVGAQGLTQLMPGTAKEVGVTDPLDPEQSIRGGAKYLKKQLDKFGKTELALAAYNAGPGNVQKYGAVPPFKETQNYVKRIMSNLGGMANAFAPPQPTPSPTPANVQAITQNLDPGLTDSVFGRIQQEEQKQGPSFWDSVMSGTENFFSEHPKLKAMIDESWAPRDEMGRERNIRDTPLLPRAFADFLVSGSHSGNDGRFLLNGETDPFYNPNKSEARKGAEDAISGLISGQTTPTNIALTAALPFIPKPLQTAAAAYFGVHGAKGAYDSGKAAIDAYNQGDSRAATEQGINAGVNALMAAGGLGYSLNKARVAAKPYIEKFLNESATPPLEGATYLGSGLGGLQKLFDKKPNAAPPAQEGVQTLLENQPKKQLPPPEEIQQITQPPTGKTRGFVETIKNSPRSAAELSKGVGGTYSPINNQETFAQAQSFVDQNPDHALMTVKSTNKPTAFTNAAAQILIDRAQKAGDFQTAIDVVEHVSKRATEQGQAIQALSMWNRLSPEGILKFAERTLKTAAEKTGKDISLTPKLAQDLMTQASSIQEMVPGYEKDFATAKMLKTIQDQVPSGFWKKVSGLQAMGQLLNPKTIIRNLGGNALFSAMENASQTLGAGIDKGVSLITGERAVTLPDIKAQKTGFLEGLYKGGKEALAGVDTAGSNKWDVNTNSVFKSKVGQTLEKAMNLSLKAPDRAFYQSAFDNSISSQMRAAAKSGKPITTPTESMIEVAHHDGLYKTFQDENVVTKVFTGLKKAFNAGKDFGFGDLIVKYAKTPANIASRGVAYTPAGMIKSLYEISKPLMGKPFNQKTFVESLSRSAIGTGVISAGFLLNKAGLLTGAETDNRDYTAAEQREGLGKFKLNIDGVKRFVSSGLDPKAAKVQKGDRLITVDWAQPSAMGLTLGATLSQKKGILNSDFATGALEAITTGAESLADQPLLKGVTQPFKTGKPTDALLETVKSIPSSFTPTILGQVRQYIDNQAGNTYDPSILKTAGKLALNKIPYLNKYLNKKINTFGEDKEIYQDGSNTFFNVFLNPAFTSRYKETPEGKLVTDIFERSGEGKQAPPIIKKNQKVFGIDMVLTPQQMEDMQRYVGTRAKDLLAKYANDPKFLNLPDDEKVKRIAGEYSDIGKEAKATILGEQVLSHLKESGDKLAYLKAKDEADKIQKKKQANGWIKDLKEADTPEKKKEILGFLYKNDKEAFNTVYKELTGEGEPDLTEEEFKIKELSPKTRATYIIDTMQGKTKEEKTQYLQNLYKKKLIDNKVMDAIVGS